MESKDKIILSVLLTIAAGFIGLIFGTMWDLSDLGVIFAIAVMGGFIISSLEKK